jgi:hypothetical protein
MIGNGDLWITEYTITYQDRQAYTVSMMEFRNGKVVHETQYFADPFEAPAWRRQWVQQIAWDFPVSLCVFSFDVRGHLADSVLSGKTCISTVISRL